MGSVLAAVGTALPETILPIIAIASGHAAGEEIGTGAILGAPFMLTTLAMVVVGVAVLIFARGGRRPLDLDIDHGVIRQDLGYFLVMYSLAVGRRAARQQGGRLRASRSCWWSGYVYYVRRHFQSRGGGDAEAAEARSTRSTCGMWLRKLRRPAGVDGGRSDRGAVRPGRARARADRRRRRDLRRRRSATSGRRPGSRRSRSRCSSRRSRPSFPRSSTRVLWVRRRKDTLAMGNMTGAMVFQSSFPVTIGLLFTPWELQRRGARRSAGRARAPARCCT